MRSPPTDGPARPPKRTITQRTPALRGRTPSVEVPKLARGTMEWQERSACPRSLLRLLGSTANEQPHWLSLLALLHPEDRVSLVRVSSEVSAEGRAAWIVLRSDPVRGPVRRALAVVRPERAGAVSIEPSPLDLADREVLCELLLAEQDRCAALWERSLRSRDEERQRIARELHDQCGSSLASVLVLCRVLEDAPSARDAQAAARQMARDVRAALDELSRLARGLVPVPVSRDGLVPALTRLARSIADSHRLQVDIEMRITDRLPPEVEAALYRIGQEALTNVARHAQAKKLRVAGWRASDQIVLRVEDDGHGFDPEERPKGRVGLGIEGIRERARNLGGRAMIRSSAAAGTVVEVRVPIRPPTPVP